MISLLLLMLMLLLSGCAGSGKPDEMSAPTGEGEIVPSLVSGEWRDNSMDPYSAVFNRPLKYTEQEGALQGGAEQYILGKDRAQVFKKHLYEEADKRWDELRISTEKGEENSLRLNFGTDRSNQAWVVGSYFDSNHCMMMDVETDEKEGILYRFFETDESMQVLRQFYAEGLDKNEYEFPSQILVDRDGNIHITAYRRADDTQRYYVIFSGEDVVTELHKEKTLEREMKLVYLYDGQVGLRIDKELLLTDVNMRKLNVLTKLKQECLACTLWDENTLLYADGEGLHRSDFSGTERETIYLWKNHGIRCSEIVDMRLSENHEVSLLYTTQETINYVKLSPTTEEVRTVEIEFAVSSSSNEKYKAAVMAFNKAYPMWHVDVKEYGFKETSLLTELAAGDGPHLIDSFLVGFEDHADWWEPLEGFYGQIDFDLIPETLEMGKIDSTPRGVVTGFCIDTMITFAESPEEWDYETFLDCLLRDNRSPKSVYNPINGSDGYPFASLFFHELGETFLYDAENCVTRFDSENFQKIMRLAKLYEEEGNQANAEDFLQGESLCAIVEIRQPEDLAGIRVIGKDKLRYIGFPTQTGSVNYLVGSDPLCIRANATAEEKQVAYAFLSFLLSDKAQEQGDVIYGQWSVRRDLLKEQIKRLDESSVSYLMDFSQISLAGHLDPERDYETLCGLLENAIPKRYAPKELRIILMEEVSGYLEGAITEDELKNHLKNRVELYLKEQK